MIGRQQYTSVLLCRSLRGPQGYSCTWGIIAVMLPDDLFAEMSLRQEVFVGMHLVVHRLVKAGL